jgi:predicted acetyltransferase
MERNGNLRQYVRLVSPDRRLRSEYNEMYQEFLSAEEAIHPFVIKIVPDPWDEFIELLEGFSTGIGVPPTFVSHSTYWMINADNRILGVSNVRHRLNERLRHYGGNVGYGIRPSERRKGYGTRILELSLEKCRELGISNVVVTCAATNVASVKIIENNGGTLEEVFMQDSEQIKRYVIALKD